MSIKRLVPLALAIVATLVLAVGLMSSQGLLAPAAVHAQESGNGMGQRYITVVGQGSVRIRPDIAKTTIGVDTVSSSVQEASAENEAILEQVLQALRDAGIADEDIQTAGFNIYSESFPVPDPAAADAPQPRYHVVNQVQVTIRDIDAVGSVLDAAIAAGANSTYGVEFRLDDPAAAQSEARAEAVADAAARADELAQFTETTRGEVLSVSEVIGSGAFFGDSFSRAPVGMGGGGDISISPGELEVTSQVQVTYALE